MKLRDIKQLNESQLLTDRKEIQAWLESMNIYDYRISADCVVDVVGDVRLEGKNLSHIPVQFDNVNGFFDVKSNNLTSLRGCPTSCISFYCSDNRLKELDFLPEHLRGGIGLTKVDVTSFEGIADKIKSMNGTVFCDLDKIKSHILGLVAIPGFRNVYIRMQDRGTDYVKAFEIVNEYAGRPNDIFECQTELIDNGFEAYAQL